jgi:hypothetical protein
MNSLKTAGSICNNLPVLGGSLLAAASSAVSTQADIFSASISGGVTVSAGGTLYFDLGETGESPSWSNSTLAGSDFGLFFANGFPSGVANNAKPKLLGAAPYRSIAQSGGGYVAQFSSGNSIDSSSTWNANLFVNKYDYGLSWPAGTRSYVGLRIQTGTDYQYGWADLEYNSSRQLTLYGFGVESTVNTPIGAGAVPEPVESTLVLSLLAGSAALYHRRQRRSQDT